jgi:RHO1 GDP-GTP exchange protein 1/2
MRRALHLKMVTQCAMLEDFGIFLVLADKVKGEKTLSILPTSDFYLLNLIIYFFQSLFPYHIEALVPSSPNSRWEFRRTHPCHLHEEERGKVLS